MFATDFLFDNQRASDLGLMICSFDGEGETASGGEIEYNTVKTPGRDRFTFYGAQFSSALEWNFSICKNPCANKNLYFNQYEESMIAKWLLKTDGYRLLQFDQPGYEDIWYRACIRLVPRQIAGATAGFDLTAMSDCAYGFSGPITKKATISQNNPLVLNVHSDVNTYILPRVTIKGIGNFEIRNHRDDAKKTPILNTPVAFQNAPSETSKIDVTMDSDSDIITNLSAPDRFNWHFLRLADGINVISTHSDGVDIEIEYREPRFVRI